MIMVRYADDFVVGFQDRGDAEHFLRELLRNGQEGDVHHQTPISAGRNSMRIFGCDGLVFPGFLGVRR